MRYAGKQISRKDLENSSSEPSDNESEMSDVSEIEAFKSKLIQKKKKPSNEESGISDEESELGDEEESDIDSNAEEGEEEEELEEEEEQRESDEDSQTGDGDESENQPNSHETDVSKGKSIQNQLSFWEHLLECRIKMHKGIQLANQLHHGPSSFKLFNSQTGDNFFANAATGAQVALKTMLDSCIELQVIISTF